MQKRTKYFIVLLALGILICSIAVAFYLATRNHPANTSQEVIHFHAAFDVYINDQQIKFTDFKYMHIGTCTLNNDTEDEDPQLEKAHLHDNIGDIVHVHRKNATWGDLFLNIRYPLPANIKAYVDGKPADNILEQAITPYERVLFYSGQITKIEEKLQRIPSVNQIKEIESKSESCGS